MKIQSVEFSTRKLVKSEDLNHHKSLYAGRGLEWLMEVGFITSVETSKLSQEYLRFIHSSEMAFTKPIFIGDIVNYKSKVVNVGTSSITVYVAMIVKEQLCGDGFLTFVVIRDGKSSPHGLELELLTEEDKQLNEKSIQLKKNTSHGKRS